MIHGIFKRNQKTKIENRLIKLTKQLCRKCNINYEEWIINNHLDINELLYIALRKSSYLKSARGLTNRYDQLIHEAEENQIKLHSNYYWLHKLLN